MRVAVATTGSSLDTWVAKQFARCHCVLILDTHTQGIEALCRPANAGTSRLHTRVAKKLRDRGVNVVVAGRFCAQYRNALESEGLACKEAAGRVRDLLRHWERGQSTRGAERGIKARLARRFK